MQLGESLPQRAAANSEFVPASFIGLQTLAREIVNQPDG